MEVHTHTHTARKKWTHYLWEFLMLFLAVFLGFIAENAREHFVEKQKGKKYLESLFQDVKKDTANLEITIKWFENGQKQIDSLLDHFDDIVQPEYPLVFRRNTQVLLYYADFIYTDRTIQQLKNAGGLRLISDKEAVDSIINYDGHIRLQEIQLGAVDLGQQKLQNLTEEIWNSKKIMNRNDSLPENSFLNQIKGWLLTNDTKTLGRYFNSIQGYKGICRNYLRLLKKSKHAGIRLLSFLQDKYHFK